MQNLFAVESWNAHTNSRRIGYLQYVSGSGEVSVVAISADTWYTILLTMDMTNNQIDIAVNATEYITNGTFHNNTDPNRVYFTSFQGDGNPGAGATIWIDELCIQ